MKSKTLFLLLVPFLLFSASCKKIEKVMMVSTGEVTNVLQNSAQASGEIIDLGNGVVQYGHCWAPTHDPSTSNFRSMLGAPSGVGPFTSQLLNIYPGTIYYIRAYVSDGTKIVYGAETSFTTDPATLPVLTTTVPDAVAGKSATCGGNVTNEGGASATHGVCWSTAHNPTITDNTATIDGTGTGTYSCSLTGLKGGTTYYVRAYATNIAGTAYGNEQSFTTLLTSPDLTTTAISSITPSAASSGGNITHDGGATVTIRGICWNTSPAPTTGNTVVSNGSGTGSFSINLSSLIAGTTYYVRAFATNSIGTAYGNEISFATTIADKDGNIYHVVTINNQVWMVENLRTTKFNDNTPIPLVTEFGIWPGLSTPAYCWYNNDATTYKNTYGALYNWYVTDVAGNGGKNACPVGWHVPNDAEWTTMVTYLGGWLVAGGKLKETGTTHWQTPNSSATNETGFTAVPGGRRIFDGSFTEIGISAYYWWSSAFNASGAKFCYMDYRYGTIPLDGNIPKNYGQSVRCMRDN